MAEFRVVQTADRSPTSCIACGQHEGPFVDLNSTIASVPTTIGVMDLDIGFYLCVGNHERPGCVVQIARMTGLTVDAVTHDETTAKLKVAEARVKELEGRQKVAERIQSMAYELFAQLPAEEASMLAAPPTKLRLRRKQAEA